MCMPAGIVYVFSQKDAESVASELQKRDILAHPYHAHMEPDDKSRVHRKWTTGKIQVFGRDAPDAAAALEQDSICLLFYGDCNDHNKKEHNVFII